jgi:6-phosphogluconolactonase
MRACIKLLAVVAVGLALLPTSLRAEFVYVANDNHVSAYSINLTTGALAPVAGSPFPAGINPTSVAVDPLGRFVYVANLGVFSGSSGNVSAYRIGANGALTPVAGFFPTGDNPFSVAVDPLGRFVYVANAEFLPDPGTVSAYRIGANGALTPVAGSPFPTGGAAAFVAVSP